MQLDLGGLNGNHLLNLLLEAERAVDGQRRTEEVWAVVDRVTEKAIMQDVAKIGKTTRNRGSNSLVELPAVFSAAPKGSAGFPTLP